MVMVTLDGDLMRFQVALGLLGYQEICQNAISILRKGEVLISDLNIVVQVSKLFNVIKLLNFLEIHIISNPHILQSLQEETVFELSLSKESHEVLLLKVESE